MHDILSYLDVNRWVGTLGYAGIMVIVFLETGIFFGFFLPGDSLVFTAGILAAKGTFNIWILIISLIVTAILGYTFGYWFGDKLGHWLLKREDSIWFRKAYVTKAHQFYERYGSYALLLGRLVPVVRTFVPIVAGMGEMSYKKYFMCNVAGAIIWGGGVTLAGYFLGSIIPNATRYLLPAIMLLVILSVLPVLIHFFRKRQSPDDELQMD